MHALTNYILGNLLGINTSSQWGHATVMFISDSIKIILILFIAISAIGVLRTYLTKATMEKYLASKHRFLSSFAAALFAIFTPFCSCSSVPIFLSLVKLRVPFASAICFLAVSPLVNEYLVVLMPKYFGVPITIAYIIGGIATGMIAGWTLEKLGFAKYLEPSFMDDEPDFPEYKNFKNRLEFGVNEGTKIVKRLWLWILAGVALGAILNIYVSDESIVKAVNFGGVFSVPLATILGAPIYGSCAGVVPIALIFFERPLPLGTVLAFLMSVSAMSLPEAVILRGAMKIKLLVAFFLAIVIGIIVQGYFINLISPFLIK